MSYIASPVTVFGLHAVASSLRAYPDALSIEPRPVKPATFGSLFSCHRRLPLPHDLTLDTLGSGLSAAPQPPRATHACRNRLRQPKYKQPRRFHKASFPRPEKRAPPRPGAIPPRPPSRRPASGSLDPSPGPDIAGGTAQAEPRTAGRAASRQADSPDSPMPGRFLSL